jgi:hypothetical protein
MKPNEIDKMLQPKKTHTWFQIFVFVLCILPLIPVWYFDYLPLQDYPNHLARLNIISSYEYSDFYKKNFQIEFFKGILPLPYIALDVFVCKFLSFIDTDKAMKVFISLYIVLYILGIYLLTKHFKQDFALFLLINLPIIYSWFFYLGFLDFIFSIPFFLFSVWLVERYKINKNKLNIFLIGFLLVFIYFTHIFTFFVLCIFLLCYLITKRLNIREFIYLIALIASMFSILLLSIKFGLLGIPKTTTNLFFGKFEGLFFIFSHLSYNLFFVSSVLFAIAIYIILRNSSLNNKLYLISSGAFLLVYLILPRVAENIFVFIDVRALLFSFILFPFSLQIKNNRHVKLAKAILTAVFFINFSWLLISFSDFNKNFSTKCADQIEDRSAILPIDAVQSEGNIMQYLHSWGYFLKYKELLTPYIFQHAHIPLKYRHRLPAPREYWSIWGNKEISEDLIVKIRETYDYILLFGNDSKVEKVISSISHEICSDKLVSLYKIEKVNPDLRSSPPPLLPQQHLWRTDIPHFSYNEGYIQILCMDCRKGAYL